MKILKLLNPQGWVGQIILIASIMGCAYFYGYSRGTKDCPPVTQNNTNIRAKKGAVVSSEPVDCDCPNPDMTVKEFKAWKKEH